MPWPLARASPPLLGNVVGLNIAESKKLAGDSTVQLNKWIEMLFSVVINEKVLTVSFIVCRKCAGKTKKIKDTLNDFEELKQNFGVGNLSTGGISWLMLFCEITKLRNHERAKSVTRFLVSRHLINWFGFLGGYGRYASRASC